MDPATPESGAGAGPLVALLRSAGALLQRIPRHRAWIPVGLWMGLISASSSAPGRRSGGSLWWAYVANLAHAPLFGLLGLWMALLLPRERGWPRIDRRGAPLVLGGVAAFGIFDELHQLLVAGRDFSVLDLTTDVTAGACVLWVAAHAGQPEASQRELCGRLLLCTGLCLAVAALSTSLPGFFPGVGWM